MTVGAPSTCLDTVLANPAFGFVVGNNRILPDTSYGYTPGSTNPNAKLPAFHYRSAILSYSVHVNNLGNRYTNEVGSAVVADTFTQPGTQAFIIFDNTTASLNVAMHVGARHNNFKEWLANGALA